MAKGKASGQTAPQSRPDFGPVLVDTGSGEAVASTTTRISGGGGGSASQDAFDAQVAARVRANQAKAAAEKKAKEDAVRKATADAAAKKVASEQKAQADRAIREQQRREQELRRQQRERTIRIRKKGGVATGGGDTPLVISTGETIVPGSGGKTARQLQVEARKEFEKQKKEGVFGEGARFGGGSKEREVEVQPSIEFKEVPVSTVSQDFTSKSFVKDVKDFRTEFNKGAKRRREKIIDTGRDVVLPIIKTRIDRRKDKIVDTFDLLGTGIKKGIEGGRRVKESKIVTDVITPVVSSKIKKKGKDVSTTFKVVGAGVGAGIEGGRRVKESKIVTDVITPLAKQRFKKQLGVMSVGSDLGKKGIQFTKENLAGDLGSSIKDKRKSVQEKDRFIRDFKITPSSTSLGGTGTITSLTPEEKAGRESARIRGSQKFITAMAFSPSLLNTGLVVTGQEDARKIGGFFSKTDPFRTPIKERIVATEELIKVSERKKERDKDIIAANKLIKKEASGVELSSKEETKLRFLIKKLEGQKVTSVSKVLREGDQTKKADLFGLKISPRGGELALQAGVKAVETEVAVLGFQLGGAAGRAAGITGKGITGSAKAVKTFELTSRASGVALGTTFAAAEGASVFGKTGDIGSGVAAGVGSGIGFGAAVDSARIVSGVGRGTVKGGRLLVRGGKNIAGGKVVTPFKPGGGLDLGKRGAAQVTKQKKKPKKKTKKKKSVEIIEILPEGAKEPIRVMPIPKKIPIIEFTVTGPAKPLPEFPKSILTGKPLKPTPKPKVIDRLRVDRPSMVGGNVGPTTSEFAGKGQFERTSFVGVKETSTPKDLVRLTTRQDLKPLTTVASFSGQDLLSRQESLTKQDTLQDTKSEFDVFTTSGGRTAQDTRTTPKVITIPKQIPKQKLEPRLTTRQRLRTPQRQRPRLRIPRPFLPVLPTSDGGRGLFGSVGARRISTPSFQAFVTQRGRDVSIGKFTTLKGARRKLGTELSTTLRAGGFITKDEKKIRAEETGLLGGQFRKSKLGPFKVIQKKGKRLGARTETREAQFFRRKR